MTTKERLEMMIVRKLNRNGKGKLSTATPLFYIYCCSAFLSDGKTN